MAGTLALGADMPAAASKPHDPLLVLQSYLSSLPPMDEPLTINRSIQQERTTDVLRVADFLFRSCMEGATSILESDPSLVTKIVSKASQRTVYLVKGSSHRSKTETEVYLCYISSDCIEMSPMHHCSCRSFWDRSLVTGKATLCKHLLALHLMPVLGIKCNILEVSTDEEFANVTVSRLRLDF